jgi:cell division protein FtsI (penicillin-binding protein 3)
VPKEGWITVEETAGAMNIRKMKIETGIIPNVMGLGLKDALYILENEGYTVSFEGHGRVMEQTPAPETEAGNECQVKLILK